MRRSPLRHRTPSTCRRTCSRCWGCGRNPSGRIRLPSASPKRTSTPWISWSMRTCRARRIGRPNVLSTKARYALERGQWAEARALQLRPSYPAADAITYFARALGAARTGDAARARKEIDQLLRLHSALKESRDEYWAEQVAIQQLAAEAWAGYAAGNKSEALK